MLFRLWKFIQLLLPYWLVIQLYKAKRSLPANIKTKSGKILRATMITECYGIIYMQKDYIKNRVKVLKEKQELVNKMNLDIAREMNSLSFNAREEFFRGTE